MEEFKTAIQDLRYSNLRQLHSSGVFNISASNNQKFFYTEIQDLRYSNLRQVHSSGVS